MKNTLHIGISLVIAFVIGLLGCSGGNLDPIGMIPSDVATRSMTDFRSNRAIWGIWHCYMEPGSGRIEAIPVRTATYTANVTKLLEGTPGNLLIDDLDGTDLFTEGRLNCTVTLQHPLPGFDRFHGFDVWGVFMHNANGTLNYDGISYPADANTGDNVATLLNPDGYTRWFNQPEFDGDGLPIFEYWLGKLSNLPEPTATLNPYIIFAGRHTFLHLP